MDAPCGDSDDFEYTELDNYYCGYSNIFVIQCGSILVYGGCGEKTTWNSAQTVNSAANKEPPGKSAFARGLL